MLILLAFQAAVPVMPPVTRTPAPEIVVNGRRTADDLAACRARSCPANAEGNAALAHAQQQFLTGDYAGARGTLTTTLGRIKGDADRYPRVVSAVYEGLATVALHDSRRDTYRSAIANSVRVLDANLPAGTPQAVYAKGRYGDMWVAMGDVRQARRSYRSAEDAADAAGRADIRDAFRLRRASAEHALGDRREAARLLTSVAVDGVPALRLAARILTARIAAADGNRGAADTLIADLRKMPVDRKPVLVSAPPLPVDALTAARRSANRDQFLLAGQQPRSGDAMSLRWADIGFWVRPDGRTAEAEVMRGSAWRGWTMLILDQIAARRYAPFEGGPGDPGSYRIERYSLGADRIVPTGSNVRQQVGEVTLRVLDLSDAAIDPTAPPID